ncbi:MAG: hypothetical protein A3Q59_04650 [Methanomethylophilus alvi]|nr:MAG: hypothetical protein A3Q59_04650 [Methanomethylophilus alvi]
MEKKILLSAVGILAIAVIAAASFVVISDNDDEKNNGYVAGKDDGTATVSSINTNLLVFGNANNDNYLNSEDRDFIQKIVDGKTTWNKTTNPLADVNADGVIDEDDLVLLDRFLSGKEARMYYLNWNMETASVKYPLTGKIAVPDVTNFLDAAIIGGYYDRIVAIQGTQSSIDSLDQTMYPGSKNFKSVGTYPYDFETTVASGATIILGSAYCFDDTFEKNVSDTYDTLGIEIIKLPFARDYEGMNWIDSILTIGVLMNIADNESYLKYVDYTETIDEKISNVLKGASSSDELTYVIICMWSQSSSEIAIDNAVISGEGYGDVSNVEAIGLKPAIKAGNEGYYKVSAEEIIKANPDVIILEDTGFYGTTHTQKEFIDKAEQIAKWVAKPGVSAFDNNRIIAAPFENIGGTPGTSTLMLMASYVYGEDKISQSDGWQSMYDYFVQFTNVKLSTLDELKSSNMTIVKIDAEE